MPFEVKVEGKENLAARLLQLPQEIADKITKKAFDQIGKEIVDAARSKVRKRSKALARSLGYKKKTYQKTNVVLIIGPRKGMIKEYKGQKLNAAKYAHLVEYGHRIVPRGSGKTSREARANLRAAVRQGSRLREGQALGKLNSVTAGNVPPMPFLRPAFEQNKARLVNIIADAINEAIDKMKQN